jgi:hypothetical protein
MERFWRMTDQSCPLFFPKCDLCPHVQLKKEIMDPVQGKIQPLSAFMERISLLLDCGLTNRKPAQA